MKEIKKEDISGLSYKDIANIVLERNGKGENTLDLFKKIINLLELPESTIDTEIANFYTSLTTDKRFVFVDGLWDLRTRHTSDKVLMNVEDDEEEEVNVEGLEEDEDMEEDIFEEEVIDDETSYDDNDDDGLSDLVIVDEDEMDLEN